MSDASPPVGLSPETAPETVLSYQQWLAHAQSGLQVLALQDPALSDVPLEARRLMADVLQLTPTALMLKLEQRLQPAELALLTQALSRRLQGEPLAYITGRWWFWDLELEVAPCTLIPRPDTELLVEQALALSLAVDAQVLDLGTGTGAIALALAKARPQWQVQAVDMNPAAVALAQRNADRLGLTRCRIRQSDWFSALSLQKFALIVSNPPYIDAQDPHLQQGDVRFEPASALVASDAGLADLRHICAQAPAHLSPGGWLWLEHGYDQAPAVRQLLTAAGFAQVQSRRDYGGQWRISGGCYGADCAIVG